MKAAWDPPRHWKRYTSIEAHTAGEPLRVLTGGLPDIPGSTILEKRAYAQSNLDEFRKALMWEPRGHADMYGCILTDPVTADGDLGVLFLHNAGFSTMCGHGVIGLVKVALDTGMLVKNDENPIVRLDTPAGRVTAQARRKDSQVVEVSFENVPSFVDSQDQVVEIPGFGMIQYDIAFGGAFYAFCDATQFGFQLVPAEYGRLIDLGRRIKRAVMDSHPIEHPSERDLSFLYGTIFIGPAHNPDHHSRNVCIFADGELDRCPTGTGVSARAAIHHARGELSPGEPFVVESILGTCFTGEITQTQRYGPYQAVLPRITGTAHITGRNEFYLDPDDPLAHGFILR